MLGNDLIPFQRNETKNHNPKVTLKKSKQLRPAFIGDKILLLPIAKNGYDLLDRLNVGGLKSGKHTIVSKMAGC